MLAQWQRRPDHPIIRDMTDRGDKALRRTLWEAAREWMPVVREHRADFVEFAKTRHIRGSNPETMLVRLLFGAAVVKQRVTDYVRAMRYWHDHPDAPRAEAEATVLDAIYKGHRGGHADSLHIVTPPDVLARLEALVGKPFDFDPFPRDREPGFDGLTAEWGSNSYGNPPFMDGMLAAAARKAIEETKKGKTATIVAPLPSHAQLLLEAGAEVVPLGRVAWLHRDTGEPSAHAGHCAGFILRGPQPAPPTTENAAAELRVEITRLQNEIADRDATIRQLEHRIAMLEGLGLGRRRR
jgi:hypothetical protein